jgi:hypothetical protein
MDDLLRMKKLKAVQYPDHKFDRFPFWQRPLAPQKLVKRTVGSVFADDNDLSVVFIGVDDRKDIGVAARGFPQDRFTSDLFVVYLVIERELYGHLCCDKFGAAFGQPNFSKSAPSYSLDECVETDDLTRLKH